MNASRWTWLGLSLALLAAGTSCGDAPAGPGAGTVTVSLVTPNTDDGAVLLAVFGPAPADIRPSSTGQRLYAFTASPTEVRVLVVGDLEAGPLLTFAVSDPGRIREYHGSVVEAASRSDAVRTTLAAYDVTFAPR